MQFDIGNEPTLSQQSSSAYITDKYANKKVHYHAIVQADFWSSPYVNWNCNSFRGTNYCLV